jgi:hypothetical protein
MRRWKRYAGIVALLFALAMSASPTSVGELRGADAYPDPPFSLSTIDKCFVAPPAPWGSVWPLAPIGRTHPIRGRITSSSTGMWLH